MESSLLSDDLLAQLMAVGQVDVLVGVPTLDHAATVGRVVHAIHRSFGTDFLRARTVLLNLDGGSKDDTPDIVRNASIKDGETLITQQSLRTIHRISTPYHGVPGKGTALRTLLAAGDLLGAQSIALFDPDVTSITPDWVKRLVQPVLAGHFDYVAPVLPRHPLDGPLVTQLVRPLVRAAYGFRMMEPLASEFACSARFASHCLAQPVWETPLARYGIDLWLALTALAGGFRCGQAPLGPRVLGPGVPRPSLPETFRQVVGALFTCIEEHQSFWLARRGSEPLPVCGERPPAAAEAGAIDPEAMADAFRSGVRDLTPVLESFLTPPTLARVAAAAAASGTPSVPDDLWALTLYEAAAAFHHDVIHREHVVQALVPLYLGRTASFAVENAEAGGEGRLEALGQLFEDSKPDLVRLWTESSGRYLWDRRS